MPACRQTGNNGVKGGMTVLRIKSETLLYLRRKVNADNIHHEKNFRSNIE